MPSTTPRQRRRLQIGVLSILLLAGGWRVLQAWHLPALSRDGVGFCWYARALGAEGLSYLRTPAAQQHPLYPVLILGTQRAACFVGMPDEPLTWQRSGQLVGMVAGLAVVALSGAIAYRLVQRLDVPVSPGAAALVAMLLAALLDRNIALSVDVMSDQVHLAFFLFAVWLLLRLDSWRAATFCGFAAGLAFLTRPEGAVPVLGGLAVLARTGGRVPATQLLGRAAVLVGAFAVCAGAYWLSVGELSAKKNPLEWWSAEAARAVPGFEPVSTQAPPLQLARLETHDVRWYGLLPFALWQMFRAGRVIIPLAALPPLVGLHKRLLSDPALLGLTTCFAAHLTLTLLLLARYDYLDPRHQLVPVMLLTPFAAMLIAGTLQLVGGRRRRGLAIGVLLAWLLPLLPYAVRTPNAADRFLVDAAGWLAANDPDRGTKTLLAGSSARRIAFYADMPYEPWWEQPDKYDKLLRQLRAAAPGYFAIEVGRADDDHHERAGNRALVEELQADADIAAWFTLAHIQPAAGGGELRLYSVSAPTHGPP